MRKAAEDRKIYRVSEINQASRELLERNLSEIWVEGEISNYTHHTSGHLYFTLKDDCAQIGAVMFRFYAAYLKFIPEEGMKVLAKGSASLFVKSGKYQIVVSYLEPLGEGALRIALEQLRKKLEKEGLFDASHKKAIPQFPRRIALLTSPTGAAIHDILSVINRRFANISISVYPVHVQGELAAGEIATAISDLNEQFPSLDVIILARGGGSFEDLMPFNEEIVARAIYDSKLPVISAVGHEVDYTISDFVADLRAPTPSAAAELVIGNKAEMVEKLAAMESRILSSILFITGRSHERYERISGSVFFRFPSRMCEQLQQDIDYCAERISSAYGHYIKLKREELRVLSEKIRALSPLNILARGYSIAFRLPSGDVLADVSQIDCNEKLALKLARGELTCLVLEKKDRTSHGKN